MAENTALVKGMQTKEIALQEHPIKDILKESEGSLVSLASRQETEKKLKGLVTKHKKEIDVLIAEEVLTVKQEERLIEIRAEYKNCRLALQKISAHNVTVLADASRATKQLKDDLLEIIKPTEDLIDERLEKEKERRRIARELKAKEEELRIQGIKDKIAEKETELFTLIDNTVYDDIETNTTKIQEEITQHTGTFDDQEAFFDVVISNVRERFRLKKEALQTAFNNSEIQRKQAHTDRMQGKEIKAKEIIFECKYATIEDSRLKFLQLFNEDYDYQEFKTQHEAMVGDLKAKFKSNVDALKVVENNRLANEERDAEMISLRKENNYNKRSAILIEKGAEKLDNGDLQAGDVVYTKALMETDEDATFNDQIERFDNEIERLRKEPSVQIDEEDVDTPADLPQGYPSTNHEQVSPAEEEQVAPPDDANVVVVPKMLDNPDLTGLKELLEYHINEVAKPQEERYTKDANKHIYEKALMTFYGDNIFDWINDQIE